MGIIQVSGKKILAGIGILLLLGVSAGCTEVQKLSWEKLKTIHYRMVTGKPLKAKDAQNQVPAYTTNAMANADISTGTAKQEKSLGKVNVALYFADQNGEYLKAEKRQIDMVPGLARASVEELIRGPQGKGLSGTIPQGTRLLDINIENGLCRVDLSKEFRDKHWGGSSGEIITVYSLVDTLTQFATVEKVEILVEGQNIDTLAGHMDLSVPVFRNSQIIREDN